jgi:hypothetical protein
MTSHPPHEVAYKHTQPGYLTAGALGAGFLFAAKHLVKGGPAALAALPAVMILGGAAVLFSSLTVEIGNGTLRSYFGPGLPARTVKIEDSDVVQVVENPWYAGWGIRISPHGTLYNVSGLQAVEVRLKDGRSFRLGTDEPDVLRRAILQAAGAANGRGE